MEWRCRHGGIQTYKLQVQKTGLKLLQLWFTRRGTCGMREIGAFFRVFVSPRQEFLVWSKKRWMWEDKRARARWSSSLLMYLLVKSLSFLVIYVITTSVRTAFLLLLIWSGSAPAFISKKRWVCMHVSERLLCLYRVSPKKKYWGETLCMSFKYLILNDFWIFEKYHYVHKNRITLTKQFCILIFVMIQM
jgi:hypothetical protein